jgi:hypothetical protein
LVSASEEAPIVALLASALADPECSVRGGGAFPCVDPQAAVNATRNATRNIG